MLVGGLSRDVGYIRATHILVKAIHAVLQIRRVSLVPLGRLMGPPLARLPAALDIIGKNLLAFDQATKTTFTERAQQLLLCMGYVHVVCVPLFSDLFNLLEPLELDVRVSRHGLRHPLGYILSAEVQAL